ncbi:hypothetical protein PENSUB_1335, partial [Penicillium subrubescens]
WRTIYNSDGTGRWLQQEHHLETLVQYKNVWQRQVPPIKGGRPRNITPVMLNALCDHL